MTDAHAILLGIVQGLTEFLPISSSAHLALAPAVCGFEDPGAGFTAVIQLGTLVAVIWYFRADIARLLTAWTRRWSRVARSSRTTRGSVGGSSRPPYRSWSADWRSKA
ncbi:MAG: undecaprenyl-diphosphate phosphatase [Pirellulales bacterium]